MLLLCNAAFKKRLVPYDYQITAGIPYPSLTCLIPCLDLGLLVMQSGNPPTALSSWGFQSRFVTPLVSELKLTKPNTSVEGSPPRRWQTTGNAARTSPPSGFSPV